MYEELFENICFYLFLWIIKFGVKFWKLLVVELEVDIKIFEVLVVIMKFMLL